MTDYVLVGGGGLARELLDWFAPGLEGSGSGFAGYLDDGDDPMAAFGNRLPHLGAVKGHRPKPGQQLVMAIGAPSGKAMVAEALKAAGAVFATLIHPTAWVSASARVDAGVVIGPFAHASADAHVGELVLQGAFAGVGHDAAAGAGSSLSGYVDLMGGVKSGRGCLFGSGCHVLPRVSIGDRCTIGAGAVVVRNVPSDTTVYAQPARSL
jgi:sugar O-acyltransferase (sialic acid O-acetyltransferase NeuD family)